MPEWAGLLTFLPIAGLLVGGCATQRPNASFNVTSDDARAVLQEMQSDPKPLARPVVILCGLDDPGIASMSLRNDLHQFTRDERVVSVSFIFCGDFDVCRRRAIEAVDKAFPSGDPIWTTEVDVVAVSMGGLVARYAAAAPTDAGQGAKPSTLASRTSTTTKTSTLTTTDVPAHDASHRRLRIARLFTISSPHRGAALAVLPTLNQLQVDMRAGSAFLRHLDEAEARDSAPDGHVHMKSYELFPYVRLGDMIVGAGNAAPAGRTAWWVPDEPFQPSHMMAAGDRRIVADIARRLRGETPLATSPPAPLPPT